MISANDIQNVVNIIVRDFAPKKIILFGSYANGQPNKDSDLDLLVVKNTSLPKIERNRHVRRLLQDVMFPVDVFVKTETEYELHKDVIGTVVYSADKYGKVIYAE